MELKKTKRNKEKAHYMINNLFFFNKKTNYYIILTRFL